MRECQKRANKKWAEENRERSNYLKNKKIDLRKEN